MRAKIVIVWMRSRQIRLKIVFVEIILIILMATAHHRLSRCSEIRRRSGPETRFHKVWKFANT